MDGIQLLSTEIFFPVTPYRFAIIDDKPILSHKYNPLHQTLFRY